MNITTTKTAARNGAGNVVAKGHGKQRTVRWDHEKSPEWNHGNAAGTLVVEALHDLIGGLTVDQIVNSITHTSNESGTKHRFVL